MNWPNIGRERNYVFSVSSLKMPAALAALTVGAGSMVAAAGIFLGAGTAAACSPYIVPGNPFVDTCGIPSQPSAAIGGSPSAAAIIACRDFPGCLAYAVNGPGRVRVPQVDTRPRQSQ